MFVSSWIAAGLGLAGGLAFAGWALSGDLLLNWDQVIGERIPIPPGIFGEGPELPRRVPLYVPLALASRVLPGPMVVAILFVASTVAAVTGVHRRAGSDLAALVVAVGYGVSPFVLTRAAVGHLPVVVAMALVPWAMAAFESGDRRRIFTWAVAFGLTGPSGAVIGLVPAALAIVWPSEQPTLGVGDEARTSSERAGSSSWIGRFRDVVLLIGTQLSWLAPGLVVLAGGGSFPTSPTEAFATRVDGIAGVFRLGTGGGFFIDPEDVANRAGIVAAVLGVVLVAGGLAGLVGRQRFDLASKSASAAAVMIVSSVEGVGSLGWQQLTAVGPFGVARDAQKFWPLVGFALAVGLAWLIRRMRFSPLLVATLVFVMALQAGSAWPGLFGADGRLVAGQSPDPWVSIEQAIGRVSSPNDSSSTESSDGAPETLIVALPWVRYERLDLSDNRPVLQPAPWLLSNDVLVSGDPGLGAGNSERADPLDRRIATLDLAVRSGAAIAPELQELGVTHVLVAGSADASLYRRLGKEDDTTVLVESEDYLLYQLDHKSRTIDTIVTGSARNGRFRPLLAALPMGLLILFIAFRAFTAVSSYVRHVG